MPNPDYSIRANKTVERYLMFNLVKAFAKASGFWNAAAYIGMGSFWFVDFLLVAEELGIAPTNMHSFELPRFLQRAESNVPPALKGLQVVPGNVSELLAGDPDWSTFLKNYDVGDGKIIWLDFVQPPNQPLGAAVRSAAHQLTRPGDVLILTFATGFDYAFDASEGYFKALAKMRTNLVKNQAARDNAMLIDSPLPLRPAEHYSERAGQWYVRAIDLLERVTTRRRDHAPRVPREVFAESVSETFERIRPKPNDRIAYPPLPEALIRWWFLKNATSLSFDEPDRNVVEAAMNEYVVKVAQTDLKNIRPNALRGIYTGALASAMIALVDDAARDIAAPVTTLFNLSYSDQSDLITIGVVRDDGDFNEPSAVLNAAFGGTLANGTGITTPLSISVPILTPSEWKLLMVDVLAGKKPEFDKRLKRILVDEKPWDYPYFFWLAKYYPIFVNTNQPKLQSTHASPSTVAKNTPPVSSGENRLSIT